MSTPKKILFITNYIGMWPFSNKLAAIYNNAGYESEVLDYDKHEFFRYKTESTKEKYLNDRKFKGPLKIFKYIQKYILFPFYFKRKLNELPSYHAIIIFYHNSFLNKFIDLFIQKTDKIIIIYAGSDFYKATKRQLNDNKRLLNASSKLVFTNVGMANDLTKHYNDYFSKFTINHFGLDIIDSLIENEKKISRENFDSIKITIGYNGAEVQQHIKIINAIGQIVNQHGSNIELIFPLTYASEKKYSDEIKKALSDLNLKAIFFENRLSEIEIAAIRVNSDIVINMQLSDQASGSLIEYMATGNVMIVADWLPYKYWDDLTFYYHKSNFETLAETLNKVLLNYKEEKIRSAKNIPIALNNFSSQSRLKEVLQIIE